MVEKQAPVRRNAAQTREKLLEAARTAFNSTGYYGTDTNKIAEAAGYAPATFYKHFADKRAIFLEVYRTWVLSEWDGIWSAARDEGASTSPERRILMGVLEHHRKWAVFRKHLRALTLLDEDVHAVRLEQRRLQLDSLEKLARSQGSTKTLREHMIFVQMAVEKTCDMIADGELESLDIDVEPVVRELEHLMQFT